MGDKEIEFKGFAPSPFGFSGDYIIYPASGFDAKSGLYVLNIADGREKLIETIAYYPTEGIDGDYVAWTDNRSNKCNLMHNINGPAGNCKLNHDVYGYDIKGDNVFEVKADEKDQDFIAISNNRIIYSECTENEFDKYNECLNENIFMFDISSNQHRLLLQNNLTKTNSGSFLPALQLLDFSNPLIVFLDSVTYKLGILNVDSGNYMEIDVGGLTDVVKLTPNNLVWANYGDKSLNYYNLDTRKNMNIFNVEPGSSDNEIGYLEIDTFDDNVVFSHDNNLYFYDSESGQLKKLGLGIAPRIYGGKIIYLKGFSERKIRKTKKAGEMIIYELK